jgi:hypothetical protein
MPEFESAPGASFFLSIPVSALATLLMFVFPLSYAYAILRHQLFDIRIIIRQGLQYAAARRLLLPAVPTITAFRRWYPGFRSQTEGQPIQKALNLGVEAKLAFPLCRRHAVLKSYDKVRMRP